MLLTPCISRLTLLVDCSCGISISHRDSVGQKNYIIHIIICYVRKNIFIFCWTYMVLKVLHMKFDLKTTGNMRKCKKWWQESSINKTREIHCHKSTRTVWIQVYSGVFWKGNETYVSKYSCIREKPHLRSLNDLGAPVMFIGKHCRIELAFQWLAGVVCSFDLGGHCLRQCFTIRSLEPADSPQFSHSQLQNVDCLAESLEGAETWTYCGSPRSALGNTGLRNWPWVNCTAELGLMVFLAVVFTWPDTSPGQQPKCSPGQRRGRGWCVYRKLHSHRLQAFRAKSIVRVCVSLCD